MFPYRCLQTDRGSNLSAAMAGAAETAKNLHGARLRGLVGSEVCPCARPWAGGPVRVLVGWPVCWCAGPSAGHQF